MLGQKQFILSLLALLPSVARPQLFSSEMLEEQASRHAEGTSSFCSARTAEGDRSPSRELRARTAAERVRSILAVWCFVSVKSVGKAWFKAELMRREQKARSEGGGISYTGC